MLRESVPTLRSQDHHPDAPTRQGLGGDEFGHRRLHLARHVGGCATRSYETEESCSRGPLHGWIVEVSPTELT